MWPGTTGKLGRAWVVHGIGAWVGAWSWLGGRGRGLFFVGLGYACDIIIGGLLHEYNHNLYNHAKF